MDKKTVDAFGAILFIIGFIVLVKTDFGKHWNTAATIYMAFMAVVGIAVLSSRM